MEKTKKSEGVTPTEKVLSRLCERTFLKLWNYPNPFKKDGKELCDLIAVFDDHIFVFFDRKVRAFGNIPDENVLVAWKRWKRKVIDKQVKALKGAEKYIRSGNPIFIDSKCETRLPIDIPENITIHKFVVAHGIENTLKKFSAEDFHGSLAICYGESPKSPTNRLFCIELEKDDPVHILESSNIEIILGELDTIHDFISFIDEKETTIKTCDYFLYFGEHELLGLYFLSHDKDLNRYRIGHENPDCSIVTMDKYWNHIVGLKEYKKRKEANRTSYLWDGLIQRACQEAFDGNLFGNADLRKGNNPIKEMAREPRFTRRMLSEKLLEAIRNFPETDYVDERTIRFMSSDFYPDKAYVLLQLKCPKAEYSKRDNLLIRREMLRIACGAARNKFPHLNTVVGIAIYSPKFTNDYSEDFILFDCSEWTEEDHESYEQENEIFGFFTNVRMTEGRVTDFPQ